MHGCQTKKHVYSTLTFQTEQAVNLQHFNISKSQEINLQHFNISERQAVNLQNFNISKKQEINLQHFNISERLAVLTYGLIHRLLKLWPPVTTALQLNGNFLYLTSTAANDFAFS